MSQGNWPLEPTVLYIYSYYPTNQVGQAPTHTGTLLRTYNEALAQAQAYITSQGNEGVCIIQPITSYIVYPFQPWQDF